MKRRDRKTLANNHLENICHLLTGAINQLAQSVPHRNGIFVLQDQEN